VLESGQYEELTTLHFEPFFYTWSSRDEDFDLDYQIASFFKSYPGFGLATDRREKAIQKWIGTEDSCRRVNNYFRARWAGRAKLGTNHVEEIYHLARRKISSILGSVEDSDLDLLRSECRHGPGGDLALPKRQASGYNKFKSRGQITGTCAGLFEDIFGNVGVDEFGDDIPDSRLDLAHKADIVDHSRLTSVPKTSQIDRAIDIQPRWNCFLQLGIGGLLNQRLRRHGIDLQDQTRNQESAKRAYVDGLATIDLSSASDSLSKLLVADLLQFADPLWWDLINLSRCQYVKHAGKLIRLEKISSMGNGYTFPLESLVFYAFSWACTKYLGLDRREIRVYGDDIIVPRAAASQLIEVLEFFGFSVNTKKTFASGDFFESCGCDYFRGREVRPFFVKEDVTCLLDLYELHNKVVEWARRSCIFFLSQRLELCQRVLVEIPKSLRLWGPTTIGGCLHSSFDVWGSFARRISGERNTLGWEGFEIRCLKQRPVKFIGNSYIAHLYSKLSGITDTRNWVVNPGSCGVDEVKVIVPRVEDFIIV
jgi:hypothetical protein